MSLCNTCAKYGHGCPLDTCGTKVEACKEFLPTEHHDPDHYKTDTIECIDCIRAALGKDGFTAYCRGQVIRYNFRLGRKDAAHKEAKKALVYAQWLYNNLTDIPLTKGIT